MDLLITVSNAGSAGILQPLLQACVRRACSWQVFVNHKGVEVLEVPEIAELLKSMGDSAVVCHDSWQRYGSGGECPITIGSQTNHSEMAGAAVRVVSL